MDTQRGRGRRWLLHPCLVPGSVPIVFIFDIKYEDRRCVRSRNCWDGECCRLDVMARCAGRRAIRKLWLAKLISVLLPFQFDKERI